MYKEIKLISKNTLHARNKEDNYSIIIREDTTICFSSIKPWVEYGYFRMDHDGPFICIPEEDGTYPQKPKAWTRMTYWSLCSEKHKVFHKRMYKLGARYAWVKREGAS